MVSKEHTIKQSTKAAVSCKLCNELKYYCSCGFNGCIFDDDDDAEEHRNIVLDKRKKAIEEGGGTENDEV